MQTRGPAPRDGFSTSGTLVRAAAPRLAGPPHRNPAFLTLYSVDSATYLLPMRIGSSEKGGSYTGSRSQPRGPATTSSLQQSRHSIPRTSRDDPPLRTRPTDRCSVPSSSPRVLVLCTLFGLALHVNHVLSFWPGGLGQKQTPCGLDLGLAQCSLLEIQYAERDAWHPTPVGGGQCALSIELVVICDPSDLPQEGRDQ